MVGRVFVYFVEAGDRRSQSITSVVMCQSIDITAHTSFMSGDINVTVCDHWGYWLAAPVMCLHNINKDRSGRHSWISGEYKGSFIPFGASCMFFGGSWTNPFKALLCFLYSWIILMFSKTLCHRFSSKVSLMIKKYIYWKSRKLINSITMAFIKVVVLAPYIFVLSEKPNVNICFPSFHYSVQM